MKNPSMVVISYAPEIDFLKDYVSLPGEYGSRAYYLRPDVQAIQAVVQENLVKLDDLIHFTDMIRDRKVIIKPNLVTVFHHLGMREQDYPETTDPRVIEAVVIFLKQFTSNIIIAESSGRGMPTTTSFRASGLDRLAKYHHVHLMSLEEQPVDRYLIPHANVMQEIVVPKIFSEVIRGDAYFISMPKMKTNLYAEITLGFKNAMGVLSYNLRQRNHNHDLNQKLVDMLHLFKADLVIIDGIVGGQGNCPAPVEPVQSRVIISGNHSVETDRVATRMMGFDPGQVPLMRLADENGFNDPDVQVVGEESVTSYKPADPSLWGEWMAENYPAVKVLIGFSQEHEPESLLDSCDTQVLQKLEMTCRGGCLAATRYAFDMLYYEGVRRDFRLTVIIGPGLTFRGDRYFLDRFGKPYSIHDIEILKGKKVAIGSCTKHLGGVVNRYVEGCMPYPNTPHMILHQLSGTACSVMSLRNRFLLKGLMDTLTMCQRRKSLLRRGQRIDVPLQHLDGLYVPREFTESEKLQPYILEPFEPLTGEQISQLCAQENRNILSTFWP